PASRLGSSRTASHVAISSSSKGGTELKGLQSKSKKKGTIHADTMGRIVCPGRPTRRTRTANKEPFSYCPPKKLAYAVTKLREHPAGDERSCRLTLHLQHWS